MALNNLKTPLLTVDIIIRYKGGIVLIERKNPPLGWALPGGFVEVNESLEEAAIREAKEETSLDVKLIEQFHAYSKPGRDPRFHTVSIVFIGDGEGMLKGKDDAREAGVFGEDSLPEQIAFDHREILTDYFYYLKTGKKPPLFNPKG
jgi:ADP-ribose pyrophosphatase YjhB (NUDIX family)